MSRGLFITFEGGEGAGKSTQIKLLAERLTNCVMTREPGGTPEADAIRNLFIEHEGHNWPVKALLLLMFSARVLHTENFIRPQLNAGRHVLCDRFTDSTRVYQGHAGGMTAHEIEEVKHAAIGDFEPDMTFILDIAPEEGLFRAAARADDNGTFEAKDLTFHEKIRQGFLSIAKDNPGRCVVIDAAKSVDEIADDIWQSVSSRLEGLNHV